MREYKQLYRHKPPESYGDCFRTAIGCLLDMPPEKVPHFYDGIDKNDDATEANRAIKYWLWQQDYVMVTFAYECSLSEVLNFMQVSNPGIFYLITGTSVTGNNHVCVGLGDDIVWDPAPENGKLVGPNSNGQIIIEVLVPASQSSGWSSIDPASNETASDSSSKSTQEPL